MNGYGPFNPMILIFLCINQHSKLSFELEFIKWYKQSKHQPKTPLDMLKKINAIRLKRPYQFIFKVWGPNVSKFRTRKNFNFALKFTKNIFNSFIICE